MRRNLKCPRELRGAFIPSYRSSLAEVTSNAKNGGLPDAHCAKRERAPNRIAAHKNRDFPGPNRRQAPMDPSPIHPTGRNRCNSHQDNVPRHCWARS